MALSVAHRGASALAPENTMAALEKAVELGADAAGLDLCLSRDGELGVIHDDTLDRSGNPALSRSIYIRLPLEAGISTGCPCRLTQRLSSTSSAVTRERLTIPAVASLPHSTPLHDQSFMRICLIGPAPPLRGGISHYNRQLALTLADRHEVTLISFSRQYPTLLFPGRTQFDHGSPAPGLTAEAMLDSLNPLSWLRAGRRIAEFSPDLVIAHWWNPFFGPCLGTTVRLARRRSCSSVIFICHNVVPHEPFPGSRGLTRFALASGDGWLVHSETDRQDLESLNLRGHTLLVPQPPGQGFGEPIDREKAKSLLGLSGNTLLFFGLIRRYKGLLGLLEAMPLVLQKVSCTLLVVGEFYEGKAHCLNLISDLGLASHVRVIDRFVPDDEVSLYFSAADLVVLPYESATQSAIVPIAYAFERPVVATRVGGLPEAVRDGETGLLVEPRNSAALAAAIIRFYEEDMGSIFRQHILKQRHFSWGELATALEVAAISRTSQ